MGGTEQRSLRGWIGTVSRTVSGCAPKAPLPIVIAALLLVHAAQPARAAPGKEPLYGPYPATVLRVIDGDTVELGVALWPGLVQRIRLRLDGVNTPEKRGAPLCEKIEAAKATKFTRSFLNRATVVWVSGVRLGKYAGRVLGKIAVNGKDLGQALLAAGLARPYHGGKRRAWCG